MSLNRTYLSASSLALFSKGFNILTTFGILWLQNIVMGKEDFGLFMMAFSLIFTLSLVLSTGFQSLILYHVSRKAEVDPAEVKAIAGQVFWLSCAASLVFSGIIYVSAGAIAGLTNQPDLQPWLEGLALYIPVNTATIVLPTYSRARHKVKESVIYQEILVNFLRAAFVGLIWALSLPGTWMGQVYIWSGLLPMVILFSLAPIWPDFKKTALTKWDVMYGLKSTAFQVLNQPFRGLDVVMVGAFSSAAVVADYSLAVRLAQLLWIPKHAAAQLQVPRMGTLLEKQDKAQMVLEYDAMRFITLLAVMAGCAVLLVAGAPILGLFGDYESALPALYILAAASLVRTGYGAAGDLIAMIAFPKGSAMISIVSVIITMGGAVLLVPYFGAAGGAYAVLLGTLQMFAGFVAVIEKAEKIKLLTPFMLAMNILPTLILMAAAAALLPAWVCGLSMLAFGGILIAGDRSFFEFIGKYRRPLA
jgi:O-antigen/teichoic acid export membrane protein